MRKITQFSHKFFSRFSENEMAVILGSAYIFCALLGNIAATKITYFGGLVMDAGFIYALTFTLRDLIHKNLGKQTALTTIWLSGVLSIIAVIYFQIVIYLPAEKDWLAQGGQQAWEFIFNLQMRIFIASVVVQIIAELIDTHVYQKWITGIGAKLPQWTRVAVSNAVSIPVDSILFPILAFAGIVGPIGLIQMFYTNILVKTISSISSFWLIYIVPEKTDDLKKKVTGSRSP